MRAARTSEGRGALLLSWTAYLHSGEKQEKVEREESLGNSLSSSSDTTPSELRLFARIRRCHTDSLYNSDCLAERGDSTAAISNNLWRFLQIAILSGVYNGYNHIQNFGHSFYSFR